MTEPDEAVERLTAQLNHLVSLESVGVMVKTADLAAVLVRAARIKELEARVAELEDMASRYLIQMSDMLTRLNERHPEDFVWLKDGDEPTAEDAYGWGCQGWGDPR